MGKTAISDRLNDTSQLYSLLPLTFSHFSQIQEKVRHAPLSGLGAAQGTTQ